jgi:PAS domain-containing protein
VIVESRQVLVRDEQGAPSAILEINRDVTERRGLEQREREAWVEMDARLKVFQVILDRLPNGVFLVQGPHLRLLLANHAAATLWGAQWPRGQPEKEFLHQQGIQLLTANGQPLPLDDLTGRSAMTTGEPVLSRQLVIRRLMAPVFRSWWMRSPLRISHCFLVFPMSCVLPSPLSRAMPIARSPARRVGANMG